MKQFAAMPRPIILSPLILLRFEGLLGVNTT